MPVSFRRVSTALWEFILVIGLATGCADTTSRPVFPDITFDHLAPVQMAISGITIEDRGTAPLTAYSVPAAPQTVLRRWPSDRIALAGGDSHATFTIVTARVTEQALDTDGNITAIFTNEQALRYDVAVEAILEINSNDGLSQGQARASANKSVTIPENATLNEREKSLFDLVEATVREFDTQMARSIRKHLGGWLR